MKNIVQKGISGIINVFRKMNIFPRLIFVMSLLTILPMLFITFFNYREYVAEIERNTQQYLSLLIGNVSVQVAERMSTYEQMACGFYADEEMLQILAENAAIAQSTVDFAQGKQYLANAERIGKRLYEIAGDNRYVQNFQFVTPYDQYCMRNRQNLEKGCVVQNLSAFRQSKYYQEAIASKGYPCWFDTTDDTRLIYKYHNSAYGLPDTITMTVAVYAKDTRDFLGELMFNIDKGFLTKSLTSYAFYGTGNTFLLGQNDVIGILNPNINAPTFDYEDGLQKLVLGHKSGQFTQKINGRNIFVSFKKADKMELYVVHIVDMDTLLLPAYKIRNRCLLLVAALLLACILLAHWTTVSISAPLHNLLKSMERFGLDKSKAHCDVSGHDELTRVSRQFNQMLSDNEKLVEEIVEANVREKTLALSKTNAELNALQMQINPHFMYNTLDLIRWEIIRVGNGESNASRMIDSFCKLMRMSIKKSNEMVPVSLEIEHAKAYIDVVNFRGNGKIALIDAIDFESNLYYMPKLTLQPLIENAVVHGFAKQAKDPIIYLRGWRIKDMLMITVTDNGKGMSPSELADLRQSFCGLEMLKDSIGLRNVNQRFRLCYGDEYGVSMESVLGMGTEITIRLPAGLSKKAESEA